MPPRPFEHQDADRKPDEALRAEARAHLGATPHLQLVAELLGRLRALDLPWWTAEMQRERWSATERMRWYRARPDLRQKMAERPRVADMSTGHLNYPAVAVAVSTGVLSLTDGRFQVSRPVSAAEAIDAVTRLQNLADIR